MRKHGRRAERNRDRVERFLNFMRAAARCKSHYGLSMVEVTEGVAVVR